MGYVEGKTVSVVARYAGGDAQRLGELAVELVRLKPDVILAVANQAAFAARKVTRTIPILVWGAHGAADTGLVASLARPGGNVTGVESLAPELDAKRMELLKELVPSVRSAAAVYNAEDQGSAVHLKSMQTAGRALKIEVVPLEVRRQEDFVPMLAAAAQKTFEGLVLFTDQLTADGWSQVAEFAAKHRVATVCEFDFLAKAGCLVSYGPSRAEFTQRVLLQMERILKGAKPADLPMTQVTRFYLTVNLKIAKALGIKLPESVLARADSIFE